jgi:hypothetical protein
MQIILNLWNLEKIVCILLYFWYVMVWNLKDLEVYHLIATNQFSCSFHMTNENSNFYDWIIEFGYEIIHSHW